jgi:nucleoside-diphosphate-sugar epimerase
MRVVVTGATGFLGPHVVAALRGHGHDVIAFARPAATIPVSWEQDSGVRVVRQDLRERRGLVEALGDADAVVHLAAAGQGTFNAQFASTVVGTENLLLAMTHAEIRRLVLVSSFSVYDYSKLQAGDLLDESAPVDGAAPSRDAYAKTKTLQEALAVKAAQRGLFDVTIVRPGIVYGRGKLWNPCLGIDFGPVFVRVGGRSRMPLTFVENCADALGAAVDRREAVGEVINIVDDDLPSRRAFVRALKARDVAAPTVVPVSWPVLRAVASLAWAVNDRLFGGAARLPSFLVPAQVTARFVPLRYSNERAKRWLGWSPRRGFEEALDSVFRNPGQAEAEAINDAD